MMRALLLLAAVALLVLGLWRWLQPDRTNTWEIRNLPVRPGPVLCFGDSLVEGVGASDPSRAYPAQLAEQLGCEVVVHGVSGLTSQEGLLEWREAPSAEPTVVVVTLGGNDILRGVPLADTERALRELFTDLQEQGCVVAYTEVLAGLSGGRSRSYRDLCRQCGVILIPDVLDGILGEDALLSDPIHPNDEGYALLARRVAATLEPYLRRG